MRLGTLNSPFGYGEHGLNLLPAITSFHGGKLDSGSSDVSEYAFLLVHTSVIVVRGQLPIVANRALVLYAAVTS